MREYYSNYNKPHKAFQEICKLKQTGTVQKYLYDIDKVNLYTKMINHYLINIILNIMKPRLCQTLPYYKNLYSNPTRWKEKLHRMNLVTIEFQKKKEDNRSKGQHTKRS